MKDKAQTYVLTTDLAAARYSDDSRQLSPDIEPIVPGSDSNTMDRAELGIQLDSLFKILSDYTAALDHYGFKSSSIQIDTNNLLVKL